MTEAERFWARVECGAEDECWEWTEGRWHFGHGRVRFDGRQERAHRVAWRLAHERPIPDGLCVLHRCDNPPCCNPVHLFLGTQGDNMADMARKGRSMHSERNHRGKLTAKQVTEIRKLYAVGDVSQKELAARYGVTQPSIGAILLGKTWTRLPGFEPIRRGRGKRPVRAKTAA